MKNVSVWSRSRLEPPQPGAAFFCPRAEDDPIWSEQESAPLWLQDLGLPEPEPPKKVTAPQHCQIANSPAFCSKVVVRKKKKFAKKVKG